MKMKGVDPHHIARKCVRRIGEMAMTKKSSKTRL